MTTPKHEGAGAPLGAKVALDAVAMPLGEKMREETQRLVALHELRRNLKRAKQTPENELVATRLDLEIEILESQSSLAAAKRTLVLLDAWEKTGRFTVMRYDGARRDGNPVVTGNPVQDLWNVRNEARSLAEWSLL